MTGGNFIHVEFGFFSKRMVVVVAYILHHEKVDKWAEKQQAEPIDAGARDVKYCSRSRTCSNEK